jgi:mono/diheme cytochrome c family protein
VRSGSNRLAPIAAFVAASFVLVLAAGCGREDNPDLSNGKSKFVEECGSCHKLARAGTQGETGPDLDEAFLAALQDGMDRDTVEGIVHDQIGNVRRGSAMPENLVTGDDQSDVAAYVAYVVGKRGEDSGALAQAGLAGATSGEQIFTAAGCGSCHTLGKAGTNSNTGPSLDDLAGAVPSGTSPEEYVRQSLLDPDAVVADGFQPGVMPSFEGRLSDKQIQALTEYLLGN